SPPRRAARKSASSLDGLASSELLVLQPVRSLFSRHFIGVHLRDRISYACRQFSCPCHVQIRKPWRDRLEHLHLRQHCSEFLRILLRLEGREVTRLLGLSQLILIGEH